MHLDPVPPLLTSLQPAPQDPSNISSSQLHAFLFYSPLSQINVAFVHIGVEPPSARPQESHQWPLSPKENWVTITCQKLLSWEGTSGDTPYLE